MPIPINIIAAVLIKSLLAISLISAMLELSPPMAIVALPNRLPCNDFLAIELSSCAFSVASVPLGFELKTIIIIADFLSGLR